MSEISEMLNLNWMTVLVGIFVLLFAVKEIIEIVGFFKNRYHFSTANEQKINSIEERLSELERRNDKQDETLVDIKDCLHRIEDNQQKSEERQQKVEEQNNETFKGLLGERLYSLHHRFTQQESITNVDYETFSTLSEDYTKRKGNHSIKNKIIPEVNNLPLKN